jgi:hypothetical protein
MTLEQRRERYRLTLDISKDANLNQEEILYILRGPKLSRSETFKQNSLEAMNSVFDFGMYSILFVTDCALIHWIGSLVVEWIRGII